MRVFLVLDTHEVELPNHEPALSNLDWTDPRLRVERGDDHRDFGSERYFHAAMKALRL